jgi:hypothetical protein
MKTCLLISGLPRQVKTCFNNINECLILPNNADVFIHSWIDDEDEVIDYINQNFKPKDFKYEKQLKIYNDYLDLSLMLSTHAWAYDRNRFIDMLYSSWYSALQVNLLKEKYRLSNNFNYDYVIRARFDITYNRPIIVSEYNPNLLNVNIRHHLPPEMIDDRFAFASNDIMNLYYSGFTLFEHLYKIRKNIDNIFCGETIVYETMKHFNITQNIINDLIITKIH